MQDSAIHTFFPISFTKEKAILLLHNNLLLSKVDLSTSETTERKRSLLPLLKVLLYIPVWGEALKI